MSSLRKNIASQHIGFVLNSAAAGTPVTAGGAGTVVIDNGAQAACAGTFTHKGTGQWDYAPTQAETNGTSISFAFTGTGAVQVGMQYFTASFDPTDTVRLGLTALPNVAIGGAGALETTGNMRIQKNAALSNFMFRMTDSADHISPKTGLAGTITGQVSIDGAAFVGLTNASSEIGNGWYKINLAAADTNGNVLGFKFTATATDQLDFTVVTQIE